MLREETQPIEETPTATPGAQSPIPWRGWDIRPWEVGAWLAVLFVAVASRFYRLGARVMSHDESLHAYYSYLLYAEGNYRHDPMMHGPFLFHMNALMYTLFGVSDATARVGPALAGIGVVATAWFFRRWIGRTAALVAAVLLTVDPSILFHSRYIRNDIYMVFYAMVWVFAMFRYVEERRARWIYLMAVTMAFAFITKENAFMTGALFGAFAALAALGHHLRGQTRWTESPYADLAVVMLSLVLPFTAPFGHLALGWDALAYATPTDILRSTLLVALATGLSLAIAYLWFRRLRTAETPGVGFSTWVGLMATFWAIAILLFTTFFTNPLQGLATGIVGSLGYWLAQQEVQRGSQPWYYYGILVILYEYLPLFLSLGAATALFSGMRRKEWQPVPPQDLPADAPPSPEQDGRQRILFTAVRRDFVLFLLWWTVTAWVAYSYAGERMPWLTTHIAQPMILLGSWWLGRLLVGLDWRRILQVQGWVLLLAVPGLVFALYHLATSRPFQGRDVASLGETVRFFLALLTVLGLLYLAWRALQRLNGQGYRWGGRLMLLGVIGVLGVLTVRHAILLTYVNYDMATEYLVYAHGGPDVKRAIAEIERISQQTVGDRMIQVAYDDDTAWPMTWYMVFFPNSRYYGANPTPDVMKLPVVLVGSKNYAKAEPFLARDYVYRTYRLIWWPEESYRGLSLGQIVDAFRDPVRRSRLWKIWFYRQHPDRAVNQWPHRHEFRMYVRRDLAEIVWDLNVTPTPVEGLQEMSYPRLELAATQVYAETYAGLPLVQPRAVAVAPDGTRYIADTGNNRIVVLAKDGTLIRTFGSTCFLSDGAAGGCVDPDGAGPLEMGDGQFREPWGIAVAPDGTVFVADTWNGRIQVFDAQGNFLRKWGLFAIAEGDSPDPYWLFGPRGLAVTPNNTLLVADTGNKRIVEYRFDGSVVRQVGGPGVVLGRFDEPVDVAVDPNSGRVYVADIWNRRIQVLSPELVPLEEWPVPSWRSQDIFDKAYVAVDSQGTVYASDPQLAQIFVFRPDGSLRGAFGEYGSDLSRFAKPNGLAVDPTDDHLLVADADNNRILVFPPVP